LDEVVDTKGKQKERENGYEKTGTEEKKKAQKWM
jgi:hypothetical protein